VSPGPDADVLDRSLLQIWSGEQPLITVYRARTEEEGEEIAQGCE
jgi:hypothetical protein